jgi:hypothetical protein
VLTFLLDLNCFTRLLIPKKNLFQLPLGSWAFFGDEFSVIHVILFNCVYNKIRDADLGFSAFGASMFCNSLSICLFLSDADEVEGFGVFCQGI